MTKATGKKNKIWNEGECFNSENDEENNGAMNENKLYKDDIQRFIEAQLKSPQKTQLRPKCLESVL